MSSSAVSNPTRKNLGDAFAIGILCMLLVNVLQRTVGFFRGIGFAHFLSDDQLGHWSLLNNFLILAVPLGVLGLPGSFGKFVEYFRKRNLFGVYYRSVMTASVLGSAVLCASIFMAPETFSYLILGEAYPFYIVLWCIIALVCTTIFCFANELVAGFRQVKAVSQMQFTLSTSFAVLGVAGVAFYRQWWVLLPAYAMSNCLGLIPGLAVLRKQHNAEFTHYEAGRSGEIWRRILPYAGTLWVINLLSNLFEASDRYMLLHMLEQAGQDGQAAVGQYHCARLLPNLLVSVASTLGVILLPYLSADWEKQNQKRISSRVRQMLQAYCVASLAISVFCLVAAPLLYQVLFNGRYEIAESLLPLTLMQATWVGLYLLADPYMLCSEKGRRLCAILLAGLVINLTLNWFLINPYGLYGGVIATAISNLLTLCVLLWQIGRNGCPVGKGTIALCLAPCTLILGPIAAMTALSAFIFLMGRTDILLSQADRDQIDQALLPKLERLGLNLASVWP